MAADLDTGIEIVGVPAQRDDDGLALSSRNVYLDDEDRLRAVALPRALGVAARAIGRGVDAEDALTAAREMILRSEEHTSELQSLMRISYAVFCLKKKKTQNNTNQQQLIHVQSHTLQTNYLKQPTVAQS